MNAFRARAAVLLPALALLAAFCLAEENAGRTEALPREVADVGITEHLDRRLPLEVRFTNETGAAVPLNSCFQNGRPVLLALVYFRCPGLCNLVLNGMAQAMQDVKLSAGREYAAIVVSFDPLETPQLAAANRERFLELYSRAGAGTGVHFLTGRKEDIRALAEAVGFRYVWDQKEERYNHAAAIYVCTPDGRLSRYLYGVQYDPQTLRLSLLEAAEGKIGTVGEQVLLFCYAYDPTRHRYSLSALRLMQLAGALTVLTLGGVMGVLWAREFRRRKKAAGTESAT